MHTFDLGAQETGDRQISVSSKSPGLCSEFQASQSYIMRPRLKIKN